MAEPRKFKRPGWLVGFNSACLVFAIVIAFFVVRLWVDPHGVQARNDASKGSVVQSSPGWSSVPAQDYKKDVELLEREIATQDRALAGERDELTRITDISKTLITVAGVFAFLLGAGSWKLLDDQQKAAREILDTQREAAKVDLEAQRKAFESQIREFISNSEYLLKKSLGESQTSLKQVTELRDELEREFPMFGRMRSNFHRILVGLESTCSQLSDHDESYKKLDWKDVQRILYFENAISTALLLDTNEYSTQLSEIYRLLGLFYGSRFAWDKGGIIGDAPRDDLHRARFYFDRSLDLDAQKYLTYLHAGYFTQFNDDLDIACISRDHFKNAAALGSQYQKPWISIALLELEAFKDPEAAQVALDRASGREEYNVGSPFPAHNFISYLRACASCLDLIKTSGSPDPAKLQKALASLSSACANPSQYVCNNFRSDTKSFLRVLKESPLTVQQFEEIAQKVQSTCAQEGLPGYN
jgi:hypothetical protein